MHHKHMFSEIYNANYFSTEANRGFVLDSQQKIKTHLQPIWPYSFFKNLEHNITYEILTNKIFWHLHHKQPF